jgi:hypothetical protein
MTDKQSIIFASALLAFAGIRLYKKYVQKDKTQVGQKEKKNSSFPSSRKDDDYEPYSKK